MRTVTVEFNNRADIVIMTDVPEDQLEACVINWESRAKVVSAQSLVDYINSKTDMTGNTAKLAPEQ